MTSKDRRSIIPQQLLGQAVVRVGQWSANVVDAAQVSNALRGVIDPEVGINIVDLGLIYAVDVSGQAICVKMAMTTPGSPMSGMMADEVAMTVAHRFPRYRVRVDIVSKPRWQTDMMSPIARLELGLAR
jgi:metal-sulfur cluster biosynthetic enzyme